MALSLSNLKEILNYDENRHNFEFFFNFVAQNLEYIGINFQRLTWRKSFLDKCRTYLTVLPVYCFYILNVNAIIVSWGNPNELVKGLMGIALAFVNVPKFAAIFMNLKEFRFLIGEVIKNTNTSYSSTAEERKILLSYQTMASFVTKVYTLSLLAVSGFLMIIPVFLVNNFWLPFSIKIPGVRVDAHPGFEIHLALVFSMVFYNVPELFGFDLCFFYMTMFISFRLDLCKYLCCKIGETSNENYEGDMIIKVAKLHIDTFKFIRKCSAIVSNVLLFQLGGALLLMTVCIYTMFLDPYAFWVHACFIGALLQFFIYCYFGQLVLTKVEAIPNALYSSNWYNLTKLSHQKLILFILAHTQTPICFSAYGLFDLSYETFTQIMKASFGYYTFLKNSL